MKQRNKVLSNTVLFVTVIILFAVITIVLFALNVISVDKIKCLDSDFQYNIISMSSIIGGFLFAGLSLIVSVLADGKERVSRLWENGYLDHLHKFAIVGIVFNVLSILLALSILITNIALWTYIYYLELILVIESVVVFIWDIIHVLSIIKLRKD